MSENGKFRLVTRSDFDGIVCAVLLQELGMIDDIKFVHPKDVQDGKVELTARDITTNLPYVGICHLVFDHHASEVARTGGLAANLVIDPEAASAARVVYRHYGGSSGFPRISEELMAAVDKADSAQFSRDDILTPKGWDLLSFVMDPRAGLGRFRQFRISNYALMMDLIGYCRELPIEKILELPDVKERTELFQQLSGPFQDQLRSCSTVHGNLVVLDLRHADPIYPGNRFVIYALHPQCNISIHLMWGMKQQNTVFAIGKSILNRTSRTDIGELCLGYGGGGHTNAGTLQVDNDSSERVLAELVEKIVKDG